MKKKFKKETYIEFNGVVYNTRYVHYNNSGEVLSISGEPDNNFKIFEIDINLIPNFVSLKKDFKKYNIDYFRSISEGTITDEDDQEDIVRNTITFYQIPIEEFEDCDLLIEHDAANKQWHFSSTTNHSILETINLVPFYVTAKDTYNYVISSYQFNPILLSSSRVSLDFLSNYEMNLDKISLLTIKKFKKYSVVSI